MNAMEQPVEVMPLDSASVADWDRYVEAHPLASLYHMSVWRDLISEVFGHRTHYLVARGVIGEIVGVLPLVQLKSRLFGNYLVSLPYFNYGGALTNTPQVRESLLQRAVEIAKTTGAAHIETRDAESLENGWPSRREKVLMTLRLPDTVAQLSRDIGPKLRSQIKRPDREGIEVVQGGVEYLSDFYEVFARNMRDLGTPVYAISFFREICLVLPNNSHIVVIKKDRRPIAAAFLLGYKDRLEIPWASSLKEHNRIGANMRLYWEALQYAIGQGYKIFDFGRSTEDSGTYRFKKQWGALPVPCHWHYWLKHQGELPQLNPSNPRYQLAIKVWQRLPVALTKVVGPRIVRNLP